MRGKKEHEKNPCSIAENKNNVENRIQQDFRIRTKEKKKCPNKIDCQSLTMSIKISFTVRNKTHVSEKNTTTNEKAPGRMKRKDYVI